jgi:PKD repeat protein
MMRRFLIAALILSSVSACHLLDTPIPYSVSVLASPSDVKAGDVVQFSAIANGGSILNMVIDYGDGSTEQYNNGGAQAARTFFSHSYKARGQYNVKLTATDADMGSKSATTQVNVTS